MDETDVSNDITRLQKAVEMNRRVLDGMRHYFPDLDLALSRPKESSSGKSFDSAQNAGSK